MSDEAVERVGALLEQMGSRFELVLEVVTGFGGRLDALREEISGQFAEVGRQIRFISEQIAENREGVVRLRAELGAEIVRLGETLGATRVEFREGSAVTREAISREIGAQAAQARDQMLAETARQMNELRVHVASEVTALRDSMRGEGQKRAGAARGGIDRGAAATAAQVHSDIAAATEAATRKLTAELKQTNKAIAELTRKFERFDDRVTIQTRDQEQRVRKLERRAAR